MFLDNLDYFHIAMRMYTFAYKPKSQVNHSWSQRQNCFLPNIFTKYFLGGVYHRCPVREKREGRGGDTSILLHLFRRDGAGELEFKQFYTVMNNLQTEVISIEFVEKLVR